MMLKALPLVHFWSVLLLKEQMMTSVRKTLKTLVWSVQNRSISSEICPENNHKIGRFLPTACRRSLPLKFPQNFCEIGRFFREFCPQKSREIWLFFRDDQKPWFRMNKEWLTWSLPTCPSPDRGGQSVSSSHKNQCTSRSTVEWLQEKERYRLCYIHLMFQVQKAQLAKQRSKRTHPKLPSLQNHRLV